MNRILRFKLSRNFDFDVCSTFYTITRLNININFIILGRFKCNMETLVFIRKSKYHTPANATTTKITYCSVYITNIYFNRCLCKQFTCIALSRKWPTSFLCGFSKHGDFN